MNGGPRTATVRQGYVLAAILVLAAAARVAGIDFGLPNTMTRPDESGPVSMAMHMAKSRLHPHAFIYPTLFPTLLLFLYGVTFGVGWVSGRFASTAAFKALYYTDPSSFYLIARLVSAGCGVLTVYLVYVIGKRLYGASAGLLAALFLALCPIHVRESHFGKVDVPMTFLLVLSALFILNLYRRGGLRDYLLSGAVSGLATSTKYNAGILCVVILVAHCLRRSDAGLGWRTLFHPHLWAAASAMLAAFLIGSPYVLIDWRGFWGAFQQPIGMLTGVYGARRQADNGVYGVGWVHHATFSLRYGLGPGMEALALVGITWAATRRRAEEIILLSLLLLQFLLIGNARWVFARYVVPLVPFTAIFAAASLSWGVERRTGRRLYPAAICLAAVLILASPGYGIWQFDRLLTREDTRLRAAAWVCAHVPDGSVIALHRGYYAEPQLPESEEMLRERLADHPGANRDAYLIDHPVRPRYRLIRIGYFDTSDERRNSWVVMDYDGPTLQRLGVGFVVTAESPLPDFGRVDDRMREILKTQATPIVVFDPFTPGSVSRPVYDLSDAFFVPMSGFDSVARPGPKITIYRLKPPEG